jgi:hypothetical protein
LKKNEKKKKNMHPSTPILAKVVVTQPILNFFLSGVAEPSHGGWFDHLKPTKGVAPFWPATPLAKMGVAGHPHGEPPSCFFNFFQFFNFIIF